MFVGEAQTWLPELIERAKKLNVNGGFEKGADLYVLIFFFAVAVVEESIVALSSPHKPSREYQVSLHLQRLKEEKYFLMEET